MAFLSWHCMKTGRNRSCFKQHIHSVTWLNLFQPQIPWMFLFHMDLTRLTEIPELYWEHFSCSFSGSKKTLEVQSHSSLLLKVLSFEFPAPTKQGLSTWWHGFFFSELGSIWWISYNLMFQAMARGEAYFHTHKWQWNIGGWEIWKEPTRIMINGPGLKMYFLWNM